MGLQMGPAFIRYRKEYEDKGEIGNLFGTCCIMTVIGCAFSIILLIIVLPVILDMYKYHTELIQYIIPCSIFAACRSGYEQLISYYRARNEAFIYGLCNACAGFSVLLITTITILMISKNVGTILFLQSTPYAIIGTILFLSIKMRHKLSFSIKVVKKLCSFGLPIILSAAAWFILELSDTYFLAYFRGFEEVAIYGLGYRVASILGFVIITPFQVAYGPFSFEVLENKDAKEKMGKIFVFLMAMISAAAVSIAILSPIIIKVMAPPSYKSAYLVVLCILPVSAMTGIYYWSSALIHIVKKTYLISIVMIIATLLNLIFNYIMIPKLGWVGAALSTNISYLFATICVFITGMHFFYIPVLEQIVPCIKLISKRISSMISY